MSDLLVKKLSRRVLGDTLNGGNRGERWLLALVPKCRYHLLRKEAQ
jgi:hypothetical protein